MLLWDYEMKPERDKLETLKPAQRLALAVRAIEWTLSTVSPPIATELVRSYLDEALAVCRAAVAAGAGRVGLPDHLSDTWEQAHDAGENEPGTSHLLSAVLVCLQSDEGVTGEDVYNVLSYCYEGSMEREDVDEWTLDAERSNERCLEIIAFQKRLIQDALVEAGAA